MPPLLILILIIFRILILILIIPEQPRLIRIRAASSAASSAPPSSSASSSSSSPQAARALQQDQPGSLAARALQQHQQRSLAARALQQEQPGSLAARALQQHQQRSLAARALQQEQPGSLAARALQQHQQRSLAARALQQEQPGSLAARALQQEEPLPPRKRYPAPPRPPRVARDLPHTPQADPLPDRSDMPSLPQVGVPPRPPPMKEDPNFKDSFVELTFVFETQYQRFISPRLEEFESDSLLALSTFWRCYPSEVEIRSVSMGAPNEAAYDTYLAIGTYNEWYYENYKVEQESSQEWAVCVDSLFGSGVSEWADRVDSLFGSGVSEWAVRVDSLFGSGVSVSIDASGNYIPGLYFSALPIAADGMVPNVAQAIAYTTLEDMVLADFIASFNSGVDSPVLQLASLFKMSCNDEIRAEVSGCGANVSMLYNGDVLPDAMAWLNTSGQ
eukprot:gene29545-5894_t